MDFHLGDAGCGLGQCVSHLTGGIAVRVIGDFDNMLRTTSDGLRQIGEFFGGTPIKAGGAGEINLVGF